MPIDENDVLKAGMEVVLRPFAGVVADIVGIAGGDALEAIRAEKKARRRRHQEETLAAAGKLIAARGVVPDPDTGPEKVEEILELAQDKSEPELRELFTRLLAAVVDPSRSNRYRREFKDVVNKLEPLDAKLLMKWCASTALIDVQDEARIADNSQTTMDQYETSSLSLVRLGLMENKRVEKALGHVGNQVISSPTGRLLRSILGD